MNRQYASQTFILAALVFPGLGLAEPMSGDCCHNIGFKQFRLGMPLHKIRAKASLHCLSDPQFPNITCTVSDAPTLLKTKLKELHLTFVGDKLGRIEVRMDPGAGDSGSYFHGTRTGGRDERYRDFVGELTAVLDKEYGKGTYHETARFYNAPIQMHSWSPVGAAIVLEVDSPTYLRLDLSYEAAGYRDAMETQARLRKQSQANKLKEYTERAAKEKKRRTEDI